jgi:putative holliday junction resolvase
MLAETLLAFDYGERRIGVALGNTLTGAARPLTVLPNTDRKVRFSGVQHLIETWQPARLIVGLPCHPDGTPHAFTAQCRRFGHQLHGRFNLPVIWVDERYSSAVADARSVHGIDAEAACIILQQYLDLPMVPDLPCR